MILFDIIYNKYFVKGGRFMGIWNEIRQKRFQILAKKPFLSTGIFALIICIITKIFVQLSFIQFIGVLIIIGGVFEGLTYILVKETKNKMESIIYIMDRIKNKDLSHSVDLSQFEGSEAVSMSFNNMIDDLKSILGSLKSISLQLVNASDMLNNNSAKINESMDDMVATIDDIARGASEQAVEAEKGVQLIMNLSEQINAVFENSNNIAKDSQTMKELSASGLEAVETLKDANAQSSEMANKVFEFIQSFVKKCENIGQFVIAINTIAEQTNLLALNAAIEAARAGEAGKGFAVVADEVRKLADDSKKATEQVEQIMQDILKEAENATSMTNIIESVMEGQNQAVNNTAQAFNVIANNIENIIQRLNDANQFIAAMEKNKNEVIEAIQNISAVSEEAAAASQEVAATVQEQRNFIQELANSSRNLNELALELRKYMDVYKL